MQLLFAINNSPESKVTFQNKMLFILVWMNSNQFKLNSNKMEIVITSSKHVLWNLIFWPAAMGTPQPKSSVKSLRVLIDKNLYMKPQLGAVILSCFVQLCKIRKISQFLTIEALIQVIIALVISRTDYANSLYLGLPEGLNHRLHWHKIRQPDLSTNSQESAINQGVCKARYSPARVSRR